MCLLSELIVARSFGALGHAGSGETERPFPEPGTPPNYAADRTCRITHIDIGLRIDPRAQTVTGDTLVTLAPLPSGTLKATLDFDEVTVTSVHDSAGEPLAFTHADGTLRVDGVAPEGGTIRVQYSAHPTRGLYFTGPTAASPTRPPMAWTQCQDEDAHRLFPCHDAPGIKQPFRLRITAPTTETVVANGRLTEKNDHEDGFTTWVWDQAEPIPAYLVMLAIGPFRVVEETANNAGTPLTLRYLAPPESDEAQLQRVFGRTPAMIEFLAERYGVPYPWARYDQVVVHDFIFGGMENVAATTLTDLVLTDERAAIDYDSDDLIVHELAHQWFGDLVTCQDWSQAWLNEGWATYTEYLWQHHHEGSDEAFMGLMGKRDGYFAEDGGRYRRSITHYSFRNPIDLFDRHLYEKGGLVIHMLRAHLGEAAFWAAVQEYLTTHSHGAVHTRDFQRSMEQSSGRNLDGFFQQFVHGAGHPELVLDLSYTEGLLNISVQQTQSGPGVAETFAFTLCIEVYDADGGCQKLKLPVDRRERGFAIPMAQEPVRVEVDPDMCVLAKTKLKASRALLRELLTNGRTVPSRLAAAAALLEDGSAEAITAVSTALVEDPFWGVRARIAGSLAKRGGPEARQALLSAIDDEHPKARRAIVAALGSFRHEDVHTALAQRVEAGDPSLQVEGALLKALGTSRAPDAAARAGAALDRSSWSDILRIRALDALSQLRDPSVLQTILPYTDSTYADRTRAMAGAALGVLASEFESVRTEATDRLIELALEAPFRVRIGAIPALGNTKDARALGVLGQLHASDGDGMLARRAYEARKKLLASRGAEASVASLRDEVEKLSKANHELRSRLDKVEGRLTTPEA